MNICYSKYLPFYTTSHSPRARKLAARGGHKSKKQKNKTFILQIPHRAKEHFGSHFQSEVHFELKWQWLSISIENWQLGWKVANEDVASSISFEPHQIANVGDRPVVVFPAYKRYEYRVNPKIQIDIVQVILFEIDCAIFYTNLHQIFCQFTSWTNWVNSDNYEKKKEKETPGR